MSCLEFSGYDLDAYSFQGQIISEKEAPFWVPAELLSLVWVKLVFFILLLVILDICLWVMIYEAIELRLRDV